jgi:Flp pilus assembly protein TadG
MKWLYRWRGSQGQAGQSLAEFALILPLLLLLLVGTIDLGLGFKTYIGLTNVAREGARWVSIQPNDLNCVTARTRIADEAGRIGLDASSSYTVTFSSGTCSYSAGEQVTVTVEHEYELISGSLIGLSKDSILLRASVTMVVLHD